MNESKKLIQEVVIILDLYIYGSKAIGSREEINLTGKRLDPNTGLYYFNQRYYDPELGRFLTEDPKHQAFNPYLFCGNNPLMYVDPDGEFFQFLIPLIIEATKVAVIEGAKAAVINAGVQWAANGFDSRKINWQSVGNTFLSAGISGGLGGAVTPGGGDIFSYALAGAVNSGISNVALKWATGKSGNMWDDFKEGAQVGALSGVAKWGFKEFVGYNASMKSGKFAQGENGTPTKIDLGKLTVEGAINTGVEIGSKSMPSFMGWFREGGEVSQMMNFFPGINVLSEIHDVWTGGQRLDFMGSCFAAVACVPAAYVVMYPEMRHYYNQGNLK